jgi:hypothetical protein
MPVRPPTRIVVTATATIPQKKRRRIYPPNL